MAVIVLRNTKTHLSRTLIRLFSSPPTPQEPLRIPYHIAKTSIRNESDANSIAEPYLKSPYHPRSYRDNFLLSVSIKKLFQLHRFDLVSKILETQQKETNWYINESFWVQIMMLYSNSQMLDQSIQIFHKMGEMQCVRSEKSFSAILRACFENRRFDLVHKFFEEIPVKNGIIPDVNAYEWVMRAFVSEKKMESALCLLRKFKVEEGLKLYISTYNVMLSGYLKTKEYEKFDEIYKEITKKGLELNLVSYNLRITRLCKSKDCYMTKKLLDEVTGVKLDVSKLNEECIMAMKLLDEMTSKGVRPNVTSFNTVIDGFCKIGDLDSANSVLERMCSREEKSVSPNKDTYFMLIQCMVKEGHFESALEMCKMSIQQNWVPHFSAVRGLVKGLVELSKENEAKEIVESVKKRLRGRSLESWTKVEGTLPLHKF
ncbi:hypothetical protein ACHQM5_030727 [Ranunculus cassubicifolius]